MCSDYPWSRVSIHHQLCGVDVRWSLDHILLAHPLSALPHQRDVATKYGRWWLEGMSIKDNYQGTTVGDLFICCAILLYHITDDGPPRHGIGQTVAGNPVNIMQAQAKIDACAYCWTTLTSLKSATYTYLWNANINSWKPLIIAKPWYMPVTDGKIGLSATVLTFQCDVGQELIQTETLFWPVQLVDISMVVKLLCYALWYN